MPWPNWATMSQPPRRPMAASQPPRPVSGQRQTVPHHRFASSSLLASHQIAILLSPRAIVLHLALSHCITSCNTAQSQLGAHHRPCCRDGAALMSTFPCAPPRPRRHCSRGHQSRPHDVQQGSALRVAAGRSRSVDQRPPAPRWRRSSVIFPTAREKKKGNHTAMASTNQLPNTSRKLCAGDACNTAKPSPTRVPEIANLAPVLRCAGGAVISPPHPVTTRTHLALPA